MWRRKGGMRIDCAWRSYRDGILCCELPAAGNALDFSQLFVNGKRQVRARWPNRDDSESGAFSGYPRPLRFDPKSF